MDNPEIAPSGDVARWTRRGALTAGMSFLVPGVGAAQEGDLTPCLLPILDRIDRGAIPSGTTIALQGFRFPGDGGDFMGIVTPARDPSHPLGGRIRPTGPVSPHAFGASGDGNRDDTAALKQWVAWGRYGPLICRGGSFVARDTLEFPVGTRFSQSGGAFLQRRINMPLFSVGSDTILSGIVATGYGTDLSLTRGMNGDAIGIDLRDGSEGIRLGLARLEGFGRYGVRIMGRISDVTFEPGSVIIGTDPVPDRAIEYLENSVLRQTTTSDPDSPFSPELFGRQACVFIAGEARDIDLGNLQTLRSGQGVITNGKPVRLKGTINATAHRQHGLYLQSARGHDLTVIAQDCGGHGAKLQSTRGTVIDAPSRLRIIARNCGQNALSIVSRASQSDAYGQEQRLRPSNVTIDVEATGCGQGGLNLDGAAGITGRVTCRRSGRDGVMVRDADGIDLSLTIEAPARYGVFIPAPKTKAGKPPAVSRGIVLRGTVSGTEKPVRIDHEPQAMAGTVVENNRDTRSCCFRSRLAAVRGGQVETLYHDIDLTLSPDGAAPQSQP